MKLSDPNIECINAMGKTNGHFYIILMNDINKAITTKMAIDPNRLNDGEKYKIEKITEIGSQSNRNILLSEAIVLPAYGLTVFEVECKKIPSESKTI